MRESNVEYVEIDFVAVQSTPSSPGYRQPGIKHFCTDIWLTTSQGELIVALITMEARPSLIHWNEEASMRINTSSQTEVEWVQVGAGGVHREREMMS